MNNRGVAILLLSAIGFLVAVVLFFSAVNRLQVVGNSTFLGEAEAQVLGTYLDGEQLMIFLETAARQSLKQEDFGAAFSSYLTKANRIFGVGLNAEGYEFERGEHMLKAVYKDNLVLEGPNVKYTVNPSFVIYY